jgi:hypothetical protein
VPITPAALSGCHATLSDTFESLPGFGLGGPTLPTVAGYDQAAQLAIVDCVPMAS